jgi:hypothetical protein
MKATQSVVARKVVCRIIDFLRYIHKNKMIAPGSRSIERDFP